MKHFFILTLMMIIVFLFGCSTKLPDLSKEEIASICNVDASLIEKKILKGNVIEYEVPYGKVKGMSQSLYIEVGPTSKKHFDQLKQRQLKSDLKEYSVGDDAIIFNQLMGRTMFVMDGKQTYKIYSMISGCRNDTKLLEIANKIIKE